jgi:hypothetical protein
MSWFGRGKKRSKKSWMTRKMRRGHFECLEPRMCLSGFTYQLPGYSTLPVSGLPILNSRPDAPAAVYLCFVGDTAPSRSFAPYSTDSDPATFNAGEQSDVYHLWQATAIYYSEFDLNVTTIQPGANGSPLVPMAWHTLTPSYSGGASFALGSFPDSISGSYNGTWDVEYRYSGATHEIGHDFGLEHQGTYDLFGNLTATYSGGIDALHGAMMGADTAQKVHKWIIGHPNGNQGAVSEPTVLQDDMAIISQAIVDHAAMGYTGDGYATDDYGGTIAAAAPLTFTGGNTQATGVIERLSDVDMYSFSTSGGRYSLSATRAMPDYEDVYNSGSRRSI